MSKFTWTLDKNDALTIKWALEVANSLNAGHTRAEAMHAIDLHRTVTRILEAGLLD